MPFDSTELSPENRILLRASKIVRERWQQYELGVLGGPRCAIGAIMEAAVTSNEVAAAIHILRKNLSCSIPLWNDMRGQTAENVANTMEQVALNALTVRRET